MSFKYEKCKNKPSACQCGTWDPRFWGLIRPGKFLQNANFEWIFNNLQMHPSLRRNKHSFTPTKTTRLKLFARFMLLQGLKLFGLKMASLCPKTRAYLLTGVADIPSSWPVSKSLLLVSTSAKLPTNSALTRKRRKFQVINRKLQTDGNSITKKEDILSWVKTTQILRNCYELLFIKILAQFC